MPRVGTGAVTLPRRLVPCYFFPLLCRFNVIGPRSDYRGAKVRWIGFKTFAPPCSLFFRLFFFSSFPRASRRRFLIYLRSLPQIQNTSNKRECFFSGRSTSGLNRVTPWPSPSPRSSSNRPPNTVRMSNAPATEVFPPPVKAL